MKPRVKNLDEWERRTLLKTIGPAGLGLIAGCIGDNGDGDDVELPTDDDDDTSGDSGPDDGDADEDRDGELEDLVDPRDYVIEGQTLRIPLPLVDPSLASFIHDRHGGLVIDAPGDAADLAMHTATGQLANGPGFHPAFNIEWHDFYSHFYEGDADSVWGREVMRIEINEDATWSDGEPVVARDCLTSMPGVGCLGPSLPGGGYDARHHCEFPDGLEGKVMEVHILPSWLGDGPKGMEPPGPRDEFIGWREMAPNVYQPQTLGNLSRRGGVVMNMPTHIWPFDEMTEILQETMDLRREIIEENPEIWNDADYYSNFAEEDPDGRRPFFRIWQDEAPSEWIEPWGGQACVNRQVARLVIGEGDEDTAIETYEQSRDPDWMTSLGLYEIAEIVGSEGYRLEPNENHMFYDEHTFDEVFLEWVDQDHREVAGLMAERYDSSTVDLAPEEQGVLSDRYELKSYPDAAGLTLSLNHAYWPGQSVYVRQGLKYALDEEAIARNLNPDTNEPIHRPGWDNWGAEEFLDGDWAQENLTSYEYDLERAEELFEQAGFERGADDMWMDQNGEPVEDRIATDSEAAVAEETIVDQWQQFGLDVSTLIQDSSTLEDRWEGVDDPLGEGIGEFAVAANMYPSSQFSGFFVQAMQSVGSANTFTFRRRARNWYDEQGGHGTPDEKVEFTEEVIREGYAPINYAGPGSFTSSWLIPPAGEFDAPEDDWVPFNHPGANNRAERGAYEYTGGAMPTNDHFEDTDDLFDPDALGVDTLWQALAWSFNWFLPDLPVVRTRAESYLNTSNWLWGANAPFDDADGLRTPQDVVEQHWDFWGLGTPHYRYPSNNMVWADPANPKLDSEVRRTD